MMKKYILIMLFTLAGLAGMAQTNETLPGDAQPLTNQLYLSPSDSTVWAADPFGGIAIKVGTWFKVDSLFKEGYTKAQVDSAKVDISNRFFVVTGLIEGDDSPAAVATNTAILQKAVDNHYHVLIPDSGIFSIKTVFYGNNVIEGAGWNTVIRLSDGAIDPDSVYTSLFLSKTQRDEGRRPDTMGSSDFVMFRNLSFDGNWQGQTASDVADIDRYDATVVIWSRTGRIESCKFINSPSAVKMFTTLEGSVSGCFFTDFAPMEVGGQVRVKAAISIQGHSDLSDYKNTQTTYVTGNHIIGLEETNSEHGTRGIFISGTGNRAIIEGNTIENCGASLANNFCRSIDLYTSGDNTVIRNNRIISRRWIAITVGNSVDVSVCNNVIDGISPTVTSVSHAISINPDARSHTPAYTKMAIYGNTILNQGSNNGISLSSSTSYPHDNLRIYGNYIEGVYDGINLGNVKNAWIADNRIVNLQRDGIRLEGVYGTITINDNQVDTCRFAVFNSNSATRGAIKLSGNTLTNCSTRGISISNVDALWLSGNRVLNVASSVNYLNLSTIDIVQSHGNEITPGGSITTSSLGISHQFGDNYTF